jgi:hypothetical protein
MKRCCKKERAGIWTIEYGLRTAPEEWETVVLIGPGLICRSYRRRYYLRWNGERFAYSQTHTFLRLTNLFPSAVMWAVCVLCARPR